MGAQAGMWPRAGGTGPRAAGMRPWAGTFSPDLNESGMLLAGGTKILEQTLEDSLVPWPDNAGAGVSETKFVS